MDAARSTGEEVKLRDRGRFGGNPLGETENERS